MMYKLIHNPGRHLRSLSQGPERLCTQALGIPRGPEVKSIFSYTGLSRRCEASVRRPARMVTDLEMASA